MFVSALNRINRKNSDVLPYNPLPNNGTKYCLKKHKKIIFTNGHVKLVTS